MRKYTLTILVCFLLTPGVNSACQAHKCPQFINLDELLKAMDTAQPILSDKFSAPKLPVEMMKYTYHGVDYYDYKDLWEFLKADISKIKNLKFEKIELDHASPSGLFEFFSTSTLCVYKAPHLPPPNSSFEMLYLH